MVANKGVPFSALWPSYRDEFLIPVIEDVLMKKNPKKWAKRLAKLKKERDEAKVA